MKPKYKKYICMLLFVGFLTIANFSEDKRITDKKSKEPDKQKKGLIEWIKSVKSRNISDLQLSPDNKRIVFTVTEPSKDNKRKKNIWILNLKTKKMLHFTTSIKSDSRPRWSPSGKTLAFLSNRNKKNQIYLIPLDGGEAVALTKSKTGIRSFKWSTHGKQIAFLSSEPKTKEEEKRKKEKDDALVMDFDKKSPLLRIINIKSRKIETLTKNNLRISEYTWKSCGKKLIISATDHPQPELFTTRIYEILISNAEKKLLAAPPGPFSNIKVSQDGKTITFLGARKDGPTTFDIFIMPASGGQAQNITGDSIDRSIISYCWQPNKSILALAQTGFKSTFYIISKDKKIKKTKRFDTNPSRNFVSNSKELIFVGQTAVDAQELWISKNFGPAKKVSDFNKKWNRSALIQPEIIKYKSFDKLDIEAALFKPKNYKVGTNIPLIVLVHGGPAGRFSERFNTWAQLLASRGFAILCPNIRGSTGYSFEFMAKNRHDWGGDDFKDVMRGVDFLVDEGIADPQKIGIGGWSYGGYMSAWAVTQTKRFKAAISGAPMTDLAFEYGAEISSINAYDTWYLGTPYENLKDFIKMSPMTYVKNVKTPTLILCGENDAIDPIGQCKQFYRGLKRYGVETQLVIYPREGHGIREEKHRIDMFFRILNWFNKYLK